MIEIWELAEKMRKILQIQTAGVSRKQEIENMRKRVKETTKWVGQKRVGWTEESGYDKNDI